MWLEVGTNRPQGRFPEREPGMGPEGHRAADRWELRDFVEASVGLLGPGAASPAATGTATRIALRGRHEIRRALDPQAMACSRWPDDFADLGPHS